MRRLILLLIISIFFIACVSEPVETRPASKPSDNDLVESEKVGAGITALPRLSVLELTYFSIEQMFEGLFQDISDYIYKKEEGPAITHEPEAKSSCEQKTVKNAQRKKEQASDK